MRYNEIQDLVKLVSKTGVSEVQLETEKVKLVIKSDSDGKKGKKGEPEVQTIAVPQVIQQPIVEAAPVAAAPAPAPVAAPAPAAAPPAAAAPAEDDSKYITIKSPMIGTAYAKPSPDKDVFVNVGDEIKPGDVICIVEAMKLFNEIESEVSGKVVKVLFEDNTPVEYDQALFLVDPS